MSKNKINRRFDDQQVQDVQFRDVKEPDEQSKPVPETAPEAQPEVNPERNPGFRIGPVTISVDKRETREERKARKEAEKAAKQPKKGPGAGGWIACAFLAGVAIKETGKVVMKILDRKYSDPQLESGESSDYCDSSSVDDGIVLVEKTDDTQEI